MQSLRDKNKRRDSRTKILASISVLVLLLVSAPFIFPSLGNGLRTLMRPLWGIEENIHFNVSNFFANFISKRALESENAGLKSQLAQIQSELIDRDTLLHENQSLKDILGRKISNTLVLGTILVKPYRSAYDTLVIDIGTDMGIVASDVVYAYGTIPIGVVSSVGKNTSTVTLFSTSGEKTTGRIDGQNIDVDLIGRGGGNFELQVPRDVTLEPNTNILIPGLTPQVVAVVAKSITDPRDPTQTFLLTSPVNVNELEWVEVAK